MERLYDLLHHKIKLHWNNELATFFQQIETSTTKHVAMTLPKRNHHYFITVDSFLRNLRCVFFLKNDKGKLDCFCYDSCFLQTNEHKNCTTYRELIGIVNSLTINEQNVIGSDQFKIVLNNHKPILSCLTTDRNFSPILYFAEMHFIKYQNFRINIREEENFL